MADLNTDENERGGILEASRCVKLGNANRILQSWRDYQREAPPPPHGFLSST